MFSYIYRSYRSEIWPYDKMNIYPHNETLAEKLGRFNWMEGLMGWLGPEIIWYFSMWPPLDVVWQMEYLSVTWIILHHGSLIVIKFIFQYLFVGALRSCAQGLLLALYAQWSLLEGQGNHKIYWGLNSGPTHTQTLPIILAINFLQ